MPGPVRTYLDPDARGPLPRYSIADDSDAMAAARTIERRPLGSTQEVLPGDVLDVADPRRPSSIAPVGLDVHGAAGAGRLDDEPMPLPRRRLGAVVVSVVAVAGTVLALAAIRAGSTGGQRDDSSPPGAAATATASPPPKPTQLSTRRAEPTVLTSSPLAAAADATTGTLRFDGTTEGHRRWVDGVLLLSDAAIVKCGPHQVRVGSLGPTRLVDVPCGGEVTLGY